MKANIELDAEAVDLLIASELHRVALEAVIDFKEGIAWGVSKKDIKALIRTANFYNLPEDHIKFK
jgi:methylglyoxal synthase